MYVPWLKFFNLSEILPQQIHPFHIALHHILTVLTISLLQATLGNHCHHHFLATLITTTITIIIMILVCRHRRLNLLQRRRLVLSESCGDDGGRSWRRRGGGIVRGRIVFGFGEAGEVAQGRSAVALTVGAPHQNGELGNWAPRRRRRREPTTSIEFSRGSRSRTATTTTRNATKNFSCNQESLDRQFQSEPGSRTAHTTTNHVTPRTAPPTTPPPPSWTGQETDRERTKSLRSKATTANNKGSNHAPPKKYLPFFSRDQDVLEPWRRESSSRRRRNPKPIKIATFSCYALPRSALRLTPQQEFQQKKKSATKCFSRRRFWTEEEMMGMSQWRNQVESKG